MSVRPEGGPPVPHSIEEVKEKTSGARINKNCAHSKENKNSARELFFSLTMETEEKM